MTGRGAPAAALIGCALLVGCGGAANQKTTVQAITVATQSERTAHIKIAAQGQGVSIQASGDVDFTHNAVRLHSQYSTPDVAQRSEEFIDINSRRYAPANEFLDPRVSASILAFSGATSSSVAASVAVAASA
jgi:hypothetical protein